MSALLATVFCFGAVSDMSDIDRDELVVFFPTTGRQTADGAAWELTIHGWIFEPEISAVTLEYLRRKLGIGDADLAPGERAVFGRRAAAFLVDNERGEIVSIRLGDNTYPLPKSAANGHFTGRVTLSIAEVERLRTRGDDGRWRIAFRAVTRQGDERVFEGHVLLLEPTGISVVSDIDDTIKITEVRDREAMLRNTFLRSFKVVPGMADVYRSWAKEQGATFHYVTASPWQLYDPLSVFLAESSFPSGTFHMKLFRWKDRSFFSLFGSPREFKIGVIEPMLKAHPQRRFVLVGDSGEKDPEAYGELARRYPQQVVRIFICDATGEPSDGARYKSAFAGVPAETWRVFREAEEIKDLRLPETSTQREARAIHWLHGSARNGRDACTSITVSGVRTYRAPITKTD